MDIFNEDSVELDTVLQKCLKEINRTQNLCMHLHQN